MSKNSVVKSKLELSLREKVRELKMEYYKVLQAI